MFIILKNKSISFVYDALYFQNNNRSIFGKRVFDFYKKMRLEDKGLCLRFYLCGDFMYYQRYSNINLYVHVPSDLIDQIFCGIEIDSYSWEIIEQAVEENYNKIWGVNL